ncbi:hypothetical protein OS42_33160 [Dickeya oryzae]
MFSRLITLSAKEGGFPLYYPFACIFPDGKAIAFCACVGVMFCILAEHHNREACRRSGAAREMI